MPLFLITPPESEPIEVSEAKHQTTQDSTITLDDEAFETRWIPAARDRMEGATDRQAITAEWEWQGPGFPCFGPLELPKPPLQSVTWIKYVDTAGVVQTWASSNYTVLAPSGPKCRRAEIWPVYNVTWPSVRCQPDAVRIRFVAGYGDSGTDVPPLLRQGMLLDIGSMFANREQLAIDPGLAVLELPGGSKDIYRSFKSRARYPLPEA